MVKRTIAGLAVLIMVLSGCGAAATEDGTQDQGVTNSDLSQVGDDNSVFEFDLQDGTHCVLVEGYHRDVALSCDWAQPNEG